MGRYKGFKNFFPTPPSKFLKLIFVIFCMLAQIGLAKNCFDIFGDISHLIYWSNARYMLGSKTIRTESILLRSDYDTPLHSAWSESSAACPRPQGGHQSGEKLAPGAFAALKSRDPQGRVHIWVCFRAKVPIETNGEARRAEPMLCGHNLVYGQTLW